MWISFVATPPSEKEGFAGTPGEGLAEEEAEEADSDGDGDGDCRDDDDDDDDDDDEEEEETSLCFSSALKITL